MWSKDIDQYIILSEDVKKFLTIASEKLVLSPRVIHRIIKLARTIADMEWNENLEVKHLAEAMQYRSKTMFVEG
jgi:magnesium chelatase family protein